MTIPDPRYPNGTGSTDAGRPDATGAVGPDTGGGHAVRPGESQPGHPQPGHQQPGRSEPGEARWSEPRSGGSRPSTPSDRASDPQPPRTTGAGGHVLGVLIGLGLTAVALVVLALGMSRILESGIGAETVAPDALGIALVTVGALLVALVALLAIQTSAVPFTGGLVALLVGAAYLFAPEAAHRETVRLLATEQNRDAVLNTSTVATSGAFFTLGLVLLAAGNAAAIVRRRGIEVGAYRERTTGRAARDR